MSKKTILMFSLGAAAGWTVAKLAAGDGYDTLSASWQVPGDLSAPAERGDVIPTEPDGIDPFSGASRSALAEVRTRSAQRAEPETEVA